MNPPPPRYQNVDPTALRLEPGLYAVSASLVMGLPWRVYDSPWHGLGATNWMGWSAWVDAFSYFRELRPVAKIGYSIWVYRVTAEDAERLAPNWQSAPTPRRG
jgi:hypothetical protein